MFGGGMLTADKIRREVKRGKIVISDYDPDCVNPNSYNLKLHPQLLIYKRDAKRANIVNGTMPNPVQACLDEISDANFVREKISRNGLRQDLELLYRNEIKLENDVNRLSLYPNIISAVLPPIDMHEENETIEFEIPEEGFVLQPGVLYIGRTVERTWTDKYIPMINGRSSGGRLGISIHICAGFGDIGFDGTWTLEITCVEPVRIYPNSEIAQVCFFKPCGKVKDLYRGRYFKQEAATASRFSRQKGDNHND